jgi:hypothetical protein
MDHIKTSFSSVKINIFNYYKENYFNNATFLRLFCNWICWQELWKVLILHQMEDVPKSGVIFIIFLHANVLMQRVSWSLIRRTKQGIWTAVDTRYIILCFMYIIFIVYRLGHGELALENTVSPPCRVETLHMLQIRVFSVSCGGEHTVALTQQGVGLSLKDCCTCMSLLHKIDVK